MKRRPPIDMVEFVLLTGFIIVMIAVGVLLWLYRADEQASGSDTTEAFGD